MLRLHLGQTGRRNHADDRAGVRVGLQAVLGVVREGPGGAAAGDGHAAEDQEARVREQRLQTEAIGRVEVPQYAAGAGPVSAEARDQEHPRSAPERVVQLRQRRQPHARGADQRE